MSNKFFYFSHDVFLPSPTGGGRVGDEGFDSTTFYTYEQNMQIVSAHTPAPLPEVREGRASRHKSEHQHV
jgi:hypothetical protein